MEEKSRSELIERIRSEEAELSEYLPSNDDADKKDGQTNSLQQLEARLPPERAAAARGTGGYASNLKQWEGTPNDIVLRSGDTLIIPKRQTFVLVSGAVYDETAVTYRPGRSAKWYLAQAGRPDPACRRNPSLWFVRTDRLWAEEPLMGGLGEVP